jgi:hypothetical protein
VLGKKDVGISITECEVLLNNVLGKKPRQMFKLMWRKMRTIEIFLENTNKRQTYYYNEAEKEKEMKTGEILKEVNSEFTVFYNNFNGIQLGKGKGVRRSDH